MTLRFQIKPINECSILIDFSHGSSTNLLSYIGSISHQLINEQKQGIMNITPAFTTILVDYLPFRISQSDLTDYLVSTIHSITAKPICDTNTNTITLPIFYDTRVGPDIAMYKDKGISLEELVELHSGATYSVGAIGFTPGFAFMQGLHERLQAPRLETPRLSIPAGSVAIAENLTAVYPMNTPGGWNIIGNCPLSLYDPTRSPMIPFSIGTSVRFQSIDEAEFLALGGIIPDHWD